MTSFFFFPTFWRMAFRSDGFFLTLTLSLNPIRDEILVAFYITHTEKYQNTDMQGMRGRNGNKSRFSYSIFIFYLLLMFGNSKPSLFFLSSIFRMNPKINAAIPRQANIINGFVWLYKTGLSFSSIFGSLIIS